MHIFAHETKKSHSAYRFFGHVVIIWMAQILNSFRFNLSGKALVIDFARVL